MSTENIVERRAPGLLRMLGQTAVASTATMALTAAYTSLLARSISPSAFGAYLLVIRAASLALPFITLGVTLALPRFLASASSSRERAYLLLGALVLAAVPWVVLGSVAVYRPDIATRMLFGDSAHQSLLVPALVMAAGYAAFSIHYGYLRGTSQMAEAGVWQVTLMGVAPAAVVLGLAGRGSIELLLWGVGLCGCLALAPISAVLARSSLLPLDRAGTSSALRSLLIYGVPRAPGGVALQSLLTLSPLVAAHTGGLADAGHLLAALMIFRAAEVGTSAFGVVILPRVAALSDRGEHSYLAERVGELLSFTCQLSIFMGLHIFVWSPLLVRAWLGSEYVAAGPVVQATVIGLPAYVTYVMLRSFIDGIDVRPVNTLNLMAALVITGLLAIMIVRSGGGAAGLALATSAGMWVLALLSALYLWRRMRPDLGPVRLGPLAGLNAVLVVPAVGAAHYLAGASGVSIAIIIALVLEGGIGVAYFLVLRRMGATWTHRVDRLVLQMRRRRDLPA
jgi:O-antigen/teichoic acid export membrane protein